ncbi:MAG: nucleoside 2-deoxyribosyltransferase [Candidatus Aenigmarchaeota archaeon]|nr:nucleoside 2-deoxyribosyltransferase [Candidatus Aenigmarchaeota archaeon]
MKIYFTYSGNDEFAKAVAHALRNFGHDVLTGHLIDAQLAEKEKMLSRFWRFERNIRMIKECDVVVAVLSDDSNFETGFEVSHALAVGKVVYMLYEKDSEKEMPVTVSGNSNPNLMKVPYENEEGLKQFLYDNFRVASVARMQ